MIFSSNPTALAQSTKSDTSLNSVYHSGLISAWDDASFTRGKKIYLGLCVNCHGQDGITASLPQARAFGTGELRFGGDPYSMFKTLTDGNGLMGPQSWMLPRERYDVIHYIREQYMRPLKHPLYEPVGENYLASLPNVRSETMPKSVRSLDRDFGPALASQLQRHISSALTIKLPENYTVSYNLHTMEVAGAWLGGFLDLSQTQHKRHRGEGQPQPAGEKLIGLDTLQWGHDGSLDYPRDGLLPRGPLPTKWFDYHGHHVNDGQVILSYEIDGRDVLELPSKQTGFAALLNTFRIDKGNRDLVLAVGKVDVGSERIGGLISTESTQIRFGSNKGQATGSVVVTGEVSKDGRLGRFVAAAVVGKTRNLHWKIDDKERMVLNIPPSLKAATFQVVRYVGSGEPQLFSLMSMMRAKQLKANLPNLQKKTTQGGPSQWPELLTTRGQLGSSDKAYTVDTLTLPESNPWNAWLRTSALDFNEDGRLVVSTYGGDVWVVSGVDDSLGDLKWKRFAAGLYEPFGVLVVDGLIHVTCKDRLVRLHDYNGDLEADFYESFSADTDVSVFFHAFNFDLQRDQHGNFYYVKSGQYTDHALAGAVIKVSPDGRKREVHCTGFRTPNGMGILPDGRVTVSDNQGNWIPASKISLTRKDGFYGYSQTHARPGHWAPDEGRIDHKKVVSPSTFDQPIIWMPQEFDNSSGGQLWLPDPRWGPISGRLLHTSFGKGRLYYLMLQEIGDVTQSAIVKMPFDFITGIHRARVNPRDGQVYATGLSGWNGGGRKGLVDGGIQRLRYTGKTARLLLGASAYKNGLRLDFNFNLDPILAANPKNYQMEQWNYRWRSRYGSDQWSVKQPERKGHDSVVAEEVLLSRDRKSVFLLVDGLQPVDQLHIDINLRSDAGVDFSENVYWTINRLAKPFAEF